MVLVGPTRWEVVPTSPAATTKINALQRLGRTITAGADGGVRRPVLTRQARPLQPRHHAPPITAGGGTQYVGELRHSLHQGSRLPPRRSLSNWPQQVAAATWSQGCASLGRAGVSQSEVTLPR